jgi:phage-related baseplate assembly protein
MVTKPKAKKAPAKKAAPAEVDIDELVEKLGASPTQLAAFEAMVEAVGTRLRSDHDALVEAARGLAKAVDDEPLLALFQNRSQNAALWKEYRSAVEAVLLIGDAEEDDGQAALLSLVRPEMGDAEDTGKAKPRTRRRNGGDKARPSADAVAATGRRRRPRTTA